LRIQCYFEEIIFVVSYDVGYFKIADTFFLLSQLKTLTQFLMICFEMSVDSADNLLELMM